MPRLNLFFSVGLDIFGDLAAYRIVGVLFDLFLVDFLVGGRWLCVPRDFSEVLVGGEPSNVHPALIIYIFEQFGHKLVILLVDCDLFAVFLAIQTDHHPVQEPHYQIVIVSAFPVCEDDATFLQKIVLKCLPIVDGLDTLIYSLVDIGGFSHGVLLFHVGNYLLLYVVIDHAYLSLIESILVGEQHDVPEDALRAEDLGVFVVHGLVGEQVEGRREDVVADVSYPIST